MTHKNIFLSLFVLANIGSLFSMEKPIFINKPVRPMKPIGKLYPDHLNRKNYADKQKQAIKEAQLKNNRRQNDREKSTVNQTIDDIKTNKIMNRPNHGPSHF